jgi:hypothetical protein
MMTAVYHMPIGVVWTGESSTRGLKLITQTYTHESEFGLDWGILVVR